VSPFLRTFYREKKKKAIQLRFGKLLTPRSEGKRSQVTNLASDYCKPGTSYNSRGLPGAHPSLRDASMSLVHVLMSLNRHVGPSLLVGRKHFQSCIHYSVRCDKFFLNLVIFFPAPRRSVPTQDSDPATKKILGPFSSFPRFFLFFSFHPLPQRSSTMKLSTPKRHFFSQEGSSFRLPSYRSSYLLRYHPYARYTPPLLDLLTVSSLLIKIPTHIQTTFSELTWSRIEPF